MAWSDERIDDAIAHIDAGFGHLREEMREMRSEMRDMRAEMRDGFRDLRGEIVSTQRQMTTIGWGIAAALLAQLVAFVVAH